MRRTGMTLMELVVGIAISGLVVLAGYAALASIIDHRKRADDSARRIARAAGVRHTLVSWLTGAQVMIGGGTPSNELTLGSAQTGEEAIQFVTYKDTPLHTATQIRLFVDYDDASPEHGLIAVLTPVSGSSGQAADSLRVQLDSSVAYFTAEYLLGPPALPSPRWVRLDELPEGAGSPSAVRLTLHSEQGQVLSPLLQLPLVFPLERTS